MIEQGTREERIQAALQAEFRPQQLVVVDESSMHAGHVGARAGGETHYKVMMEAVGFVGMGRLARSRAVHSALAREFASGLHALALTLRAPGE